MKTQINFRIEEELFRLIREEADKNKIPYTQWIINIIEKELGLPSKESSNSYSNIEEKLKELNELYNYLAATIHEHDQAITSLLNTREKKAQKKVSEAKSIEGITSTELARKLNVNPATVSRWANGKRGKPLDFPYTYNSNSKLWIKH